jgi:NADPH:quinone reductase-like Zn-dependent oxidoreductase
MKAVYISNYGGIEELTHGDLPMPEVGDNDVLVRVYAAAVNPVDWKIRKGFLQKRIQFEFPLILGWDVAGVVEETGKKVTRFKKGDQVFSRPDITRNGTYAEYVAVDENLLAHKPSNLSFEEAASVPLAGLTAWGALVEIANLKSGDKVLIHAGAGGVGVYAVQLAKSLGAYVTATVSGKNVDFVRALGADQAINYQEQDFSQVLQGFDVVFDTMGGEIQRKSYDVLKEQGLLVTIVTPPEQELADEKHVRAEYFFLQPDGEKLAKLGQLIEQGTIRPVVGHVFPLQEAAKAHELSESQHARGKIVLQVQ